MIGHPLSLSGDVGPQARHLAAEAERIAERLGLPLKLWDERLTTVRAEQLLAERGTRNGRRKRTVDAMVAAIILQEYLDTQNTMKAPNTVEEDFNANG